MAKLLDNTVWKFALVGVANTLFGAAIMFGCYNLLHLDYWVSSAANYFFGSILSYVLNKRFTFQHKGDSPKSLARFVINIVLCYLLAYGVAKPLVAAVLSSASAAVQDNVAMFSGLVLFTVLNYFGQRFFVFQKGEGAGE